MKKTLQLMALLVMCALVMSSCGKDPKGNGDDEPNVATLSVNKEELKFKSSDKIAQEVTITVEHTEWEAEIVAEDDWIKINETKGAQSATVKVSMKSDNTAFEKREGKIIFKATEEGVDSKEVKIIQEPAIPVPVFKVTPTVLEFKIEGGDKHFGVEIEYLDKWTATSNVAWLKLDLAEGDKSEQVKVTAEPNDGRGRSGEIEVSAEGKDPIKIAVSQKGNIYTPVWDLSLREMMNYSAEVQKASYYFNLGVYPDAEMLANAGIGILNFAEDGKIVDFGRSGSRIRASVFTYDDAGRITMIDRKDGSVLGPQRIEIEYGTHGKYVAMDQLIRDLEYKSVVWRLMGWFPKFVKDVTKVTFTSGGTFSKSTLTYTATVDGNKITFNCVSENYGTVIDLQKGGYSCEMIYDAGAAYPKSSKAVNVQQSDSENWYDFTYTYTFCEDYLLDKIVSEEKIKTGEIADPDITELVVTTEFNSDRLNTIRKVTTENMTAGNSTAIDYEYDEHLNVVKVGDRTIGYEYDEKGNWTSVSGFGDVARPNAIEYFGEDEDE